MHSTKGVPLLLASVTSILGLGGSALANETADGPLDKGRDYKPRSPDEKVSFQIEDADLAEIVRVVGEMTGKRFLIAAQKLKGVKVTIVSPGKVSVAEAYQAFLAALAANGLTVLPEGPFWKIVESQDAASRTTPIYRAGQDVPAEERFVTRVHRLAHVGADEAVKDVLGKFQSKEGSAVAYAPGNLVIVTDTGANVRRLLRLLEDIDVPAPDAKLFFHPLRYVSAQDIERKLGEIFDTKRGAAGMKIVALDRPNALVIVATREVYEKLAAILDPMDPPPSGEARIHIVPLAYTDAKRLVQPLSDVLGSAAAAGGRPGGPGAPVPGATSFEGPAKVSADEGSNALVVTCTPRDFVAIADVIRALDRPKKQVYLEAVILDLSAERATDLDLAWHGGDVASSAIGSGSQLAYGGFRAGTSALPPSGADLQAFALGIRGPDIPLPFSIPSGPGQSVSKIPGFGALIAAKTTQRGSDVVSTPHIIASDNVAAELRVQLNTSLQPNAPAVPTLIPGAPITAAAPATANYKAIGPKIKLTPHLNESDTVRLDVEETISDVQSAPDRGDTFGTVSYIDREAKTTVTIKDGETIVIGGLMRNRRARSETKVPLLGDIPLLGALFRTSHDGTEKSNLVLLVTPHIIRDHADMRRIFEEKMHERRQLAEHDLLFGAQKWEPPPALVKPRGFLFGMRTAQAEVEAKRGRAGVEATAPAAPVTPLDLPVPVRTWGAAPPHAPDAGRAAATPGTRLER